MKKSVIIGAAAVVVVAAGGYTAWWYNQADVIKQNVVAWFSKANASEEAKNGNFSAAYDDIAIDGFPSFPRIAIVNPNFIYTPHAARKILFPMEEQPAAETAATEQEKLKDEWKIDGKILIESNALKHQYSISGDGVPSGVFRDSQGEITWKGNSNQWKVAVVTDGTQDEHLMVGLNLSNPEEVEKVLESVRHFEFSLDTPIEMKNTANDEVLLNVDEMHTIFNINAPNQPQREMSGQMMVKGAYVSEDYQKAQNRFYAQFYGLSEQTMQDMTFETFSNTEAGKQDMDVAFDISIPKDFDAGKDGDMKISIPSFKLKNDFYNINMPFNLTYQKKADQVNSALKLDGKLNYSPKLAESLQKNAQKFVDGAFEGGSAVTMALLGLDKKPDPEAFSQQLQKVIPDFEKVGDINILIDGGFKGNVVENNPAPAGDVEIRNIEIGHNLWALKASGKVTLPETRSDLAILCRDCDLMIDNLLVFARDAQDMAMLLNKDYKPFPITEQLIADVKNFSRTLGKSDNGKDVHITVVSDGTGKISISGKPLEEVTALAMQTFLPYMMQMEKGQQVLSPSAQPDEPAKPEKTE